MTVKDILINYLKKNKYDGLYYPGECHCIPYDLIPCGNDPSECKPGVKVPCTCGLKCDFDIGGRNEEV